jgi:uncharacterized protein (DUF486 family)
MQTILLLTVSNIFMTMAWYGHLKYIDSSLWAVMVRERWGCMTWEKRVTGVYRHPALVAQLAGSNVR